MLSKPSNNFTNIAAASVNSAQNRHYGQMFLAPGAPINPDGVRCFGGVWTLDRFKECQEDANEQLARIANSVKSHIPQGLEVNFADIKSDVRTIDKAENEKNGDYGRITDRVRLTLLVDDIEHINYIANTITPSKDPNVVLIEDAFTRPNKENGMRRMKILYRLESGMIGEIMVLHSAMRECDKLTRIYYEEMRRLEKRLSNYGCEAGKRFNIDSISYEYARCAEGRQKLPAEFAQKCGIDKLEIHDEERAFYAVLVDNELIPVMTMPDPYMPGRPRVTVRPDYEKGFYVVDTSLKAIIDDANSDRVIILGQENEDPRDEFIDMSIRGLEEYRDSHQEDNVVINLPMNNSAVA